MSRKLGILIVHGIGSQTQVGFKTSTADMIEKIVSVKGGASGRLAASAGIDRFGLPVSGHQLINF